MIHRLWEPLFVWKRLFSANLTSLALVNGPINVTQLWMINVFTKIICTRKRKVHKLFTTLIINKLNRIFHYPARQQFDVYICHVVTADENAIKCGWTLATFCFLLLLLKYSCFLKKAFFFNFIAFSLCSYPVKHPVHTTEAHNIAEFKYLLTISCEDNILLVLKVWFQMRKNAQYSNHSNK